MFGRDFNESAIARQQSAFKFMAVGDLLVTIRWFMVGSSIRMGAAHFRVAGGTRLQMVSKVDRPGNRQTELHQKQLYR